MNQLTSDQNPVDRPDEKPALTVVLDLFKECYDRAFRQVASDPLPQPDPVKDKPIDLTVYQNAIATLDLDFPTLQKQYDQLYNFVSKADAKSFMSKFPSGQKFCLNLIPQYSGGIPTADLSLSQVSAKGLTYGPSSDPAYYFLNFPEEIQKKCTFYVSTYQNPHVLFTEEREEIKRALETAWNSLIELLKIAPSN